MKEPPYVPPRPGEPTKLALFGDFLTPRGRSVLTQFTAKAYQARMFIARVGWMPVFVVNDPDTVREVMQECPRRFPKHQYLHEILTPLLGDSIFNTNGERWARDRRLVDQAFAQAGLRRAFPVMRDACDAMLARLESVADGRTWDAEAAMSHVTADIIFRTILSESVDEQQARAINADFAAYQKTSQRVAGLSALRLPVLWYMRRCRALGARIRATFAKFTQARWDAVQRGETDLPEDMLTTLIRARDPETGAQLDPVGLVDQFAILFLAGHETSASSLSWALYVLACQPVLQQQLREEVRAHWGDAAPEFGDTRRLSLTHDVFRETLRLYPPIAFYMRQAAEATCLREKPVDRGDAVVVSPWLVQRHRLFWQDPDVFEPRRFDSASGMASAKGAYIPFGVGERVCPGAAFATQEALLILAQIVRRFRVEPVPGHTPQPVARLTLRSANGIRLRLRPA
jgi:cytochrome P450